MKKIMLWRWSSGFNFLAYLLVTLLPFWIYQLTMAPGVWGFDSAELATGVFSQGIVHPPGYPLYMLIGKFFILIPIGDVAYRLNLMSGLFGALTVLGLYKICYHLTQNSWIACCTSLFFSFTNYFWQMAIVAEVYTLHTFFLVANLYLILVWQSTGKQRYLFLFAILFGLAMCNHTSGLLFLPGYVWLLLAGEHWKNRRWFFDVPIMIVLFCAGLSLYLYFPGRVVANPPLNYIREYPGVDLKTLQGILWMASARVYQLNSFGYRGVEILDEMLRFIKFFWRNNLGVGVLLGCVGVYYLLHERKKKLVIGIALLLLPYTIFYINYRVIDKDTMFLPVFLVWMILVAFGMAYIVHFTAYLGNRNLISPGFQYLIHGALLILVPISLIMNWKWVDMRNATGPSIFAQHILDNVQADSIVIGQWSTAVVLEYYQVVEKRRPDLMIVNRSREGTAYYYNESQKGRDPADIVEDIHHNEIKMIEDAIAAGNAVYLIEYDLKLKDYFEFVSYGDYFEILKKR